VAWFREGYQRWIDTWLNGAGGTWPSVSDDDYFVYGPEQDCCKFRIEYWRESLAISGWGDSAIYLLNPNVVTPEGEWEAWFFANWNPGAVRYRSFWDLMQSDLATIIKLVTTACNHNRLWPPNQIDQALQVLLTDSSDQLLHRLDILNTDRSSFGCFCRSRR